MLTRREAIYLSILLVAGLAAPFAFYPVFLMSVLCFAIYACAYNLLFGYAGLLAFGHAAFFGSASYSAAHAAKFWGLSVELTIVVGMTVSAILGYVIGKIAIRRQGLYFAMITLALAQIVYFYALQADWTHGEDGIQSVPRNRLFGLIDVSDNTQMYYVVLAVFILCFMLILRTVLSPFGVVLRSIRDNEPRALSLGYDVTRHKLMAFVMSAALAGVAGSLNALIFGLASLSDVHMQNSVDVLLAVLIGGIGTIIGPLFGAVIMVTMQNFLAPLGTWVLVLQGLMFILFVLTLKKGVAGTAADAWARWRLRRRVAAANDDDTPGRSKAPGESGRLLNVGPDHGR